MIESKREEAYKAMQAQLRWNCLQDKNENGCVGNKVLLPSSKCNCGVKHCFFIELVLCPYSPQIPKQLNCTHRQRSLCCCCFCLVFSFYCSYCRCSSIEVVLIMYDLQKFNSPSPKKWQFSKWITLLLFWLFKNITFIPPACFLSMLSANRDVFLLMWCSKSLKHSLICHIRNKSFCDATRSSSLLIYFPFTALGM